MQVSCIILAGGKAERLNGNDKGLELFKGKRLIEHVIDRISPQVDDIVINANRNLDEYRNLGFSVVPDKARSYDGPLAGIQSAIAHCRHSWVLVVPCDMPALPVDLVATLSQHIDDSPLVTVRCNHTTQLVFLMHNRLLESVNAFLASDQRTVMRWLDTVDARIVDMDNENHFHNIKTLEQLQR